MNSGPEFSTVESPFIDQFIGMGWKLVANNLDQLSATGSEMFRKVWIKSDLRQAVGEIDKKGAA